MNISVTDPISPAIERTKTILFRPFDLTKWMAIGFCAFLSSLGEGGGGGNFGQNYDFGGGGGGGEGNQEVKQAVQWVEQNLPLVLGVGAAILLLSFLFGMLLLWLGCRGRFMFIDAIVKNKGVVAEPWREYKQEANSLFWIRFLLSVIGFLLFAVVFVVGIVVALPDLRNGKFDESAFTALLIAVPAVICLAILFGIINFVIWHFITPIMYLHRVGVGGAWEAFTTKILPGRLGTLILFWLMQIVIGLVMGAIGAGLTCATCCMTAIPYVGTVILLPLFVFHRSYDLYFLQQFGKEWLFFEHDPSTGRDYSLDPNGG